jgi:hypothetical protein
VDGRRAARDADARLVEFDQVLLDRVDLVAREVERGHLRVAEREHFVVARARQALRGVGEVGPEEAAEAEHLVADAAVVFVPEAAALHRERAQAPLARGVVEVDHRRLAREGSQQRGHQQLAQTEMHGGEGYRSRPWTPPRSAGAGSISCDPCARNRSGAPQARGLVRKPRAPDWTPRSPRSS